MLVCNECLFIVLLRAILYYIVPQIRKLNIAIMCESAIIFKKGKPICARLQRVPIHLLKIINSVCNAAN